MINEPLPNIHISGKIRNRLLSLLIIPMTLISLFFSAESYLSAQAIAKKSFDESLTILTLAIMGQSENLIGDALPENTLDLINNSTGDIFFYHINATNASFITGYSNPPMHPDIETSKELSAGKTFLFDSTYQKSPVRVALYRQFSDDPNYTGWIELTVWKYLDKQYEFQNRLFTQFVSRLAMLIVLIIFILWFGIRHGLKPLISMQDAIARRSISDLSPITIPVPFEVKSLVESMNDLFLRLSNAIEKRAAFLGNASHQLKTPLARIRAQSELALREKDPDLQKQEIERVVNLTRHTSRLTNQMLSLLRAESDDLLFKDRRLINLNKLAKSVAEHYALEITRSGREFIFEPSQESIMVSALPIMLTEAISNLIENAMAYSRPHKDIVLKVQTNEQWAELLVVDNGPGIAKKDQKKAMQRFYRIPGTQAPGCGLGLAIVNEIIKSFKGTLFFAGPEDSRFAVGFRLLQATPETKSNNQHQ